MTSPGCCVRRGAGGWISTSMSQHLKHVGNQLDGAANRLVVGIVVAALIIGSSIVMTVSGGPTLLGLPLFGLLGYLGAAAGGAWLLLSIWKSNRADRE
jgi:ubiquinone biosynthesis protein